MDENERLRQYLEAEIKAQGERLEHWARRKAEANQQMEKHQKALDHLLATLRYLKVAEGEDEPIMAEKPYGEMSIVDGTYLVLTKAGRPLHVSAIWEELRRGGKTLAAPKPTVSITGALLRDQRFRNVGGNTFILAKAVEEAEQES